MGNILSISGSMKDTLGQANPLRYRGYVYDDETGMYYCQSRYYDPEIGRFLNSDVVYDVDAGLQGYNLFIYCGNNPKNRIDASGFDSEDNDSKVYDSTPEEEALLLGSGGKGGTGYGNNFRGNLVKSSGINPAGYDAHHIFPKAYTSDFASIDIDNQNPFFGSWVEAHHHRSFSYEYNQWWYEFFNIPGVTRSDAFALVDFLSQLFGFNLNF